MQLYTHSFYTYSTSPCVHQQEQVRKTGEGSSGSQTGSGQVDCDTITVHFQLVIMRINNLANIFNHYFLRPWWNKPR